MALAALPKPHLWMFAGPNGSGKSTFYSNARFLEQAEPFWIINPDLLTSEIAEREGIEWLPANGRALDRIKAWLDASIEMYRPVGFETVLSSDKYFPLIERALSLGFELHLIYVALRSPDLNIERVRKRVAAGGHDVDEDKIVKRRTRSLINLERVLPMATFAQIWDNSTSSPTRLFEKRGDEVIILDAEAIPEVTARVEAAVAKTLLS